MEQLKNHMINYMTVRGYSPKTISAYTKAVATMANRLGKCPLDLSTTDLEAYFLGLREGQFADATIQLTRHAINFFYRIHGITDRVPRIRNLGKHSRLPLVLSRVEVADLLGNCSDLKSKTVFNLIYSCGLRISEATNLKISDIDFDRRTVFVRRGKSKKDRLTVLGERMTQLLREYLLVYAPTEFLFYSRTKEQPLSTDAIQRRFRLLLVRVGMDKPVHVHTLRHCFATHLLENGTSIVYIMRLLGHSSIQTTMVYLHVQSLQSMNIQSPMDTLPLPRVRPQKQPESIPKSA